MPAMVELVEQSLAGALRTRGLRVTPQRLAIARVLRELGGHVTAEAVFGEVGRRMPGVSLPTVYATLELIEQLGLARRVEAGTGAAVYDVRVEDHGHVVCRRCGAIADLDAPVDRAALLGTARAAGFAPDSADVVVRGLCASCRA
jgi:Fe2+ or Zn2+ uptake regulation protein